MSEKDYDWAVVGAGPAGIAAVGKLLDLGVSPQKLLWVDPEFKVGDFGTLWSQVPSNTKVGVFLQFLHAVKSFHYIETSHQFKLSQLNINDTCLLEDMAEPLRWVSNKLKNHVVAKVARIDGLSVSDRYWRLKSSEKIFSARHVILATGSEP